MVSVIIVNYNTGKLLEQCVRSLIDCIDFQIEIIVVDNGSIDGSADFIGEIDASIHEIVLINNDNVGFARANNIGARHARGSVYHFLNPDTVVDVHLACEYAKILESIENVIWVTPLLNPDGTMQKSRYPCPGLINYIKYSIGLAGVWYWYLGASVIIRKQMFEELSGWSEDYFMYAEDLDLFFKAMQREIETVVLSSKIIHFSEGSTSSVWSAFERLVKIEKAGLLFAHKYQLGIKYYLVWFLGNGRLLFGKPCFLLRKLSALRNAYNKLEEETKMK